MGHAQRVRNRIKSKDLPYDELDLFYKEDALVCMFNGPTEDWMYNGFESHYQ